MLSSIYGDEAKGPSNAKSKTKTKTEQTNPHTTNRRIIFQKKLSLFFLLSLCLSLSSFLLLHGTKSGGSSTLFLICGIDQNLTTDLVGDFGSITNC
jgi:hypothetical protein